MSHLPDNNWHGYVSEVRRPEITVTSALDATDIASATLYVRGLDPLSLTAEAASGGYLLVADLELPSAGAYVWQAEATDTEGFTEVVAEGVLSVSVRISAVAA